MSNLKLLCTSLFVLAMLATGLLESAVGSSQMTLLQFASVLR